MFWEALALMEAASFFLWRDFLHYFRTSLKKRFSGQQEQLQIPPVVGMTPAESYFCY